MNKPLITTITTITTFSVMPPLNFAWLPEWNSYGSRAATTRTRKGDMSRFLVIVVITVMDRCLHHLEVLKNAEG